MFVIPDHPITKGYQDIKRRGIHIRFIAEIRGECFILQRINESSRTKAFI